MKCMKTALIVSGHLLFAENSLYSIQSVTIIAAFPVVILSILFTLSFFKDASKYLDE